LKKIIKKYLNSKGWVNKSEFPNSKFKVDHLYLLLFSLQKENIKIIQIGANDGVTGGDPIHQFIKDFNTKITYIGFEPQKYPYEKLKQNYQKYKNFYFIILFSC